MSGFLPGSEGLLKPLQVFLDDRAVSEVLINRPQEIWIEKQGELTRYQLTELTLNYLKHLFQLIAVENQQQLTESHPLLSGSLPDGSRVQLCLPPAGKYPTLSIRRQITKALDLEAYQNNGFYHSVKPSHSASFSKSELALQALHQKQDWHRFMKKAIQAKKNIIISGGTSSGKTTYLNACLSEIALTTRIITLEDIYEIKIPHPNQVNLLATKGNQGKSTVSMQDLIQCCLRLRPDRIIMGEIRGKEILDFISACGTGHEGSITSIHANNPEQAFQRMVQLYKLNNVPAMTDDAILKEIESTVDIIVQLEKSEEGRRVQSIYYKYARSKPKRTGTSV